MRTESEIKEKGMKALLKELGELDTEIFIKMISRESFDYTEWQKDLWSDKTVEQISSVAMKVIMKIENFPKGMGEYQN